MCTILRKLCLRTMSESFLVYQIISISGKKIMSKTMQNHTKTIQNVLNIRNEIYLAQGEELSVILFYLYSGEYSKQPIFVSSKSINPMDCNKSSQIEIGLVNMGMNEPPPNSISTNLRLCMGSLQRLESRLQKENKIVLKYLEFPSAIFPNISNHHFC